MDKKILAVTGCPTGIAHTYMSAEALEQAAKEMNISLKVEKRGAMGVEDGITEEEIQAAHAIIIAADTDVQEARFAGKPIVKVPVAEAIRNPKGLLEEALAKEPSQSKQETKSEAKPKSSQRNGVYKHLMTGVSNMLPLVVAGGLLIALSFAFGGIEVEGTFAQGLSQIGASAAFALMIPVLSGFIAFSIADRLGLAPGLVGGMLASQTGAGFLGGIISGFLAGYIAKAARDYIKVPKSFDKLKAILIIPFVSTLIVGLLMVFVVGTPMKAIMDGLTNWLTSMESSNAVILGLVLGGMIAFDMGGPVNKAAYAFAVGLLASDVYGPMAAVMAAGMTPPLGLWLATVLAPKKFNQEEKEAGKAASLLGLSFITEGAIPFAAADPVRIIPSIVTGSAVTGALAMIFDTTLRVPHGGIFVLPIPNAVGNLGMYAVAIVVGTIVTALMTLALKRKINE